MPYLSIGEWSWGIVLYIPDCKKNSVNLRRLNIMISIWCVSDQDLIKSLRYAIVYTVFDFFLKPHNAFVLYVWIHVPSIISLIVRFCFTTYVIKFLPVSCRFRIAGFCKITVQSTLLTSYWFNSVRIGITLEIEESLNMKTPSYTSTGIPTHYKERTVSRLYYSCNGKLYTQKCDLYIENHFSSQWIPYPIVVHYCFNPTLISSIDAGSSTFSDSIADKSETSTSRFPMRKDIAFDMIALCSSFIWNF